MKNEYSKIEYADLVTGRLKESHILGDDNEIILLDEFSVEPVSNHEFTSIGNYFIEVIDGEGTIEVNGTVYPVQGHSLIVYLQGQKIRTNITSAFSVQRAAIFSDSFMEMLYHDAPRTNEIRYSIIKNPVVPLDEQCIRALDIYVFILRDIAKRPDFQIACAEYATLAFFYGPLQTIIPKKMDSEVCRNNIVSTNFFKLLKKYFKTEHELSYYSKKLNVSRQYLHISILTTSGKSPGYWIDQYLAKEAKKMLLDPNLLINDISSKLNFAGSKQFGRFFKKQTGLTPRDFRKLHDEAEKE